MQGLVDAAGADAAAGCPAVAPAGAIGSAAVGTGS